MNATAPNPVDHMRLVGGVLKQYSFRDYEEDDLKQDGMLALCRAARAFSRVRGKFSVYAYNAIRTELWRHVLVGNGPVPLKRDAARSYYKMKKAKRTGQPDGLLARDRELGEAVGACKARVRLSIHKSLDDLEPGQDNDSIKAVDDRDELEVAIGKAKLSPDHTRIMLEFYGIGCEPKSTLELGEERGWTRSYIGMIIRRSIAKIRRASEGGAS